MLPLPLTPHHHITKGLFIPVLFIPYVISAFNKKFQGILKWQKTQFEGTEQTLKPESDMAEVLELSD